MISMGGGGRWESAKATLARTVFLGVEGRTAVGEDVVSSILWHRWTFIHNKQTGTNQSFQHDTRGRYFGTHLFYIGNIRSGSNAFE